MIPMNGMIAMASPYCAFQSAMNQSTLKNFSSALTTPINAPPAMNPEAISVPLFRRASFRALSFERVLTYQEIAPPTSNGRLRSIGMNIPSANANAGILKKVSTMASTAPIP